MELGDALGSTNCCLQSFLRRTGRIFAVISTQERVGSPDGIRTRVSGLKGRRPRPLDDGAPSQMVGDQEGRAFSPLLNQFTISS